MELKPINSFLGKFLKIFKDSEAENTLIKEIIEEVIKNEIHQKNISKKGFFIYIKISPSAKNEISIYKNNIIEKINNNLNLKIKDIFFK